MNNGAYPVKVGEYNNRFFDSTVWNDFHFRSDDIVIASYAKAGTTWLQQIVAQLVFSGRDDIDVASISPWLDSVHPDKETKYRRLAMQQHRRFIKTHLPADRLVFNSGSKYVYVARDGRDIAWSLYDHQCAVNSEVQARLDAEQSSGGRLRVLAAPSMPVQEYFANWLANDGAPFWPFWENLRSWWALREKPFVLLVHYADLLRDLPTEIDRIAKHLDVDLSSAVRDLAVHHASFDFMRAHAARYVPEGMGFWRHGGKAFFNRGRIGRWQGQLAATINEDYEKRAVAELGADCAHWLAHGRV